MEKESNKNLKEGDEEEEYNRLRERDRNREKRREEKREQPQNPVS